MNFEIGRAFFARCFDIGWRHQLAVELDLAGDVEERLHFGADLGGAYIGFDLLHHLVAAEVGGCGCAMAQFAEGGLVARRHVGRDQLALQRFYHEASKTGILKHPNIVIVYLLAEQDGMPYIVMEFVAGEPLDKIIKSGREISLCQQAQHR